MPINNCTIPDQRCKGCIVNILTPSETSIVATMVDAAVDRNALIGQAKVSEVVDMAALVATEHGRPELVGTVAGGLVLAGSGICNRDCF